MRVTERREIRYEGDHCHLLIQQLAARVIVLKITGTDVGEFGEAPMKALNAWMADGGPIEFFIDARDAQGASMEVSGDWAAWLTARKGALAAVTMLTGSPFVQVTAGFVRRFAGLEGVMRICCEPAVFDGALADALKAARSA